MRCFGVYEWGVFPHLLSTHAHSNEHRLSEASFFYSAFVPVLHTYCHSLSHHAPRAVLPRTLFIPFARPQCLILFRCQCFPRGSVLYVCLTLCVRCMSIQTDFLLVVLRDMVRTYQGLRVILMSATVDTSLFTDYFGQVTVVEVYGRVFPVQGRWPTDSHMFDA